MLGFIGNSFIGERMFDVIKPSGKASSFELKHYLIY